MPETTVFQSGNSQAVRLPKEFRFNTKTVEIFRRGDEVVLREKPRTLGDLLASLPPVTPEMSAEIEAIRLSIKQPLPPDTRSWDALHDHHAAPPADTPTAAKPRRTKAKPGKR